MLIATLKEILYKVCGTACQVNICIPIFGKQGLFRIG